jgi:superfamily I DNA/RNA helicase
MQLGDGLDLDPAFVADEADYALGRFLPGKLDSYLSAKREGRGKSPKFDKALREQFLSEVIGPYIDWKDEVGEKDWNDLAVELADNPPSSEYDVVVIDEAQDFAANQIRAVSNYLAEDHSITFLLDAAQRIYPRYFSWSEVGVSITPNNSHKLNRNHRNTKEIAAFARPIVTGLDIGDDGALPDFSSCQKSGPKPTILRGRYSSQVAYCIKLICKTIDLKKQSVAFLHAKGGGWFDTLRKKLSAAGIEHVEIARSSDWPSGPANVALCTMHSAKGLEFDHVFIIGLNAETTPHGSEPGDSQLEALRRLLAMAVSRARESVVVGFKPQEASSLVEFFDPVTYVGVDL